MFKTNADVALHLHYLIMALKVFGKEWLYREKYFRIFEQITW